MFSKRYNDNNLWRRFNNVVLTEQIASRLTQADSVEKSYSYLRRMDTFLNRNVYSKSFSRTP